MCPVMLIDLDRLDHNINVVKQSVTLYGRSPNQEMVNGSPTVGLNVEDQVFLRPIQTESVLLQFGDLLAVRGGKIVETWPVY